MKMPILMSQCVAISLSSTGANAANDAVVEDGMPEHIACAQERGEALGQCTYRVKRDESGKVTVRVAFANGFKRKLFFADGKFLKASVTMSGVGTDTQWSVEDGTHMIRVDGQRYELPDALIVGDR